MEKGKKWEKPLFCGPGWGGAASPPRQCHFGGFVTPHDWAGDFFQSEKTQNFSHINEWRWLLPSCHWFKTDFMDTLPDGEGTPCIVTASARGPAPTAATPSQAASTRET